MSVKRPPSIKEQVVLVLSEHGPLKAADMMPFIKGAEQHSVESKLLEMMKDNQVDRDANMVYSLHEGVTANTLKEPAEDSAAGAKGGGGSGAAQAAGIPLDARQMFENLLKSVAVKPPEIIPTIGGIFWGGDIDNLKWLETVLRRHAAGWVAPNQIRLVLSSWSQTRGLPYNENEFIIEPLESAKGAKAAPEAGPKSVAEDLQAQTGIGYKIEKDRDGDWVPKPGGSMTYVEALSASQKSNYIKAIERGQPSEASEPASEASEGKSSAKGGKVPRSFDQMFMEKALDVMFDKESGKGSGENAEVKLLREEIRTMKDQQDREWRERMEANLAAALQRDPLGETRDIEHLRQRLGITGSGVTDSSPAVQLIKDASDKANKNLDRLTGMVERMVLKSDEFRPEETRSAAEKESKAGAILQEAEKKARSQELGKRAFTL